ncbi:hypothetical protein [Streptomyces decoyicus]|uniref:hypothetical protein n=1 Tax=Streptomyces decoyicus TaxID=249567 RepID=UPI0006623500|nr:hypothetical protein [Streptomyces decoyicus]QZY18436.1 hypothetical protein K7C20_26945 [Streptomyces decoyicus]
MASNDGKFKPAEVHVPKNADPAPSGSGAAQEQSYEIGQSRPQFTKLRLNQVKQMVEGSNPGEVGNVAEGWKLVRIKLVGGGHGWNAQDWNDGIKKKFDDAVTKVLETWHGHSAEQFATAAQKISNNFAKLAAYPHNTGYVLHQISEHLADVKKAVADVEEPSELERIKDRAADGLSSGAGKGAAIGNAILPGGGGAVVGGLIGGMTGGDGRDDTQLNADLANPKMSIFDAVNKNRGSLSIDRERELQAAHYMEQLATTYRAGVTAIGKPPLSGGRDLRDDEVPDYDGGGGAIPPIAPYGPAPSGPKGGTTPNIPGVKGGGYTTPQPLESPRPHGIDGGVGSIPKSPAPHIGTGLDGLSGGGIGAGGGSGTGGIGGGGAGGGVGGGVGTGGLGSGGGSGSGIAGGGMPGMVGGATGRTGGAGAGAGARGGRAGMPGMGGAAGGGAKGAGAKGAGGKGGAMARQKGGLVGGKGGKTGAAGQGGSGLHRSRGGTQSGATGGRRPAGMAGAHGAHGAKGKDKGSENGQRPDYLVEDEETWTPERNVAPKVIE